MLRIHGCITALTAAVGLACGAAWAQDEERATDALAQPGVETTGPNQPLEDDRIDEDVEDSDELASEIDEQQELSEQRQALEQAAESTIEELRAADPDAATALDEAYGYAVFDTTEGGLIVTGSGGTGVAKVKDTGESTFMHVGGAGVGLGAGGENYKLVLVFPNEQTYNGFVDGDWEAGASAQAAAGEEGAASEAITDEVHVYHLTDAGLIAQADITGMKFWPSEELNGTDVAGAEDERDLR